MHEKLRDAILRGQLPAGASVSQVTLAEDLDVGRTPLRESLRMLQLEGLVVSEPNRRVQIAPLSSTDAEELYVMRIALEVIALRLTIPILSSQDLAELEGYMAQMEHFQRNDDRPGLRAPHRMFHLRLVAAAGPRGLTTIAQLFDHAERYRLAFGGVTPQLWELRQAEHREIVDAVTARDVDRAGRALANHYAQTAVNVLESLDPSRDLARMRETLATVAPGSEKSLNS